MALSKQHAQPSSFGQWYVQNLTERPILTKACTAASLSFASAVVSEKVVQGKRGIDVASYLRFALISFVRSPLSHFWFGALERVFAGRKGKVVVFLKILIDQLIWSPISNAIFYAIKCIVEGRPGDVPREIRLRLWPTMLGSWRVWPIAQYFNFSYVPLQFRVLFSNIIGFFWGIYLVTLSSRAPAPAISKKP